MTDCLRQLVLDDRLVLDIENHNFQAGGRNFVPKDPKPYTKKKLSVLYSFDGGPLLRVEQEEGFRLELPESAPKHEKNQKNSGLVVRREWRDVIYDQSPGVWRLADPGEVGGSPTLLLWVENPIQQMRGARGTDHFGLIALIRVEHYGTMLIPRAYWLDATDNTIDLRSGFAHAVVVGHFSKGNLNFVSYENPCGDSTYNAAFAVPFRELGNAQNIRLSRHEAIIYIYVSIVISTSNEVIECAQIKIHLPTGITELVHDA